MTCPDQPNRRMRTRTSGGVGGGLREGAPYPVRTHFKTDFEARLSEKLVGKAGGEKGSEAYWSTSRTVFVDNAAPRAL